MATINMVSLREKTSHELVDQLLLEKKRLFDAVVKGASGEAIKPHEKRDGRRLIARIESVLSERKRRHELDAEIVKLTPKAVDAAPLFVRSARDLEERTAAVGTEAGKRRPMPARIRLKHLSDGPVSAADRAAVQLAEAKRRRLALARTDPGQGTR